MENGDNRQPKSGNSQENGLNPYYRLLQYVNEQNKRTDVVIAEVEEFLKAYKDGNIILTPEAQKLTTTTTEYRKRWIGISKKVVTSKAFCDSIGAAIAAYQVSKELNYQLKWENAYTLLDLIQRARAFGAVKDKNQQEKDYLTEIEQLKQRADSLQKLNNKLVAENKRLHNLVPEKKEWEAGDVGK
jgi:hypothetical protein